MRAQAGVPEDNANIETFHCLHILGHPRLLDLGHYTAFTYWDIPRNPGLSQDLLDLGHWDITLPYILGHLVYPRTSWTWDTGTLHCLYNLGHPKISWGIPGLLGPGTLGLYTAFTSWDIPRNPGVSQDFLDLGHWDFTLPLHPRTPQKSWAIPGLLGPGTLGLYTAFTSWDIPRYPGVFQDFWDLGHWDFTLL